MFPPQPAQNREAHVRISGQVERFLSNGGSIQNVDPGVSGFNRLPLKTQWSKSHTARP